MVNITKITMASDAKIIACIFLVCFDGGVQFQSPLSLPRESVLSGMILHFQQWLRNQMQPAGHPAVAKVSTCSN